MDVIQILIEWDTDKKMIKVLNTETEEENVSSPTFLALSNDHLECANFLVKYGISLKKGEAESIMVKILLEKVIVKDLNSTNGTYINGERITELEVEEQITFRVGVTEIRIASEIQ